MWYFSVGDDRAHDAFRVRLRERREERFSARRRQDGAPLPDEGWWAQDTGWVELVGGPLVR